MSHWRYFWQVPILVGVNFSACVGTFAAIFAESEVHHTAQLLAKGFFETMIGSWKISHLFWQDRKTLIFQNLPTCLLRSATVSPKIGLLS